MIPPDRGSGDDCPAAQLLPDVAVIGLHTVFEHYDVTGPAALRVFVQEFGLRFPVGIDRHDGDSLPVTMRTYALQGTPSTLVVDRAGRLRLSHFGRIDDLALGGLLGRLLAEEPASDGGGGADDGQEDDAGAGPSAPRIFQ